MYGPNPGSLTFLLAVFNFLKLNLHRGIPKLETTEEEEKTETNIGGR